MINFELIIVIIYPILQVSTNQVHRNVTSASLSLLRFLLGGFEMVSYNICIIENVRVKSQFNTRSDSVQADG